MDVLTTTPFGQRPVTAGLLARAAQAQAKPAIPHSDKWELFHQICAGRELLGVTSRNLTVLNALLSFHPGTSLSDNDNLIVFPSNAKLCQRAHGMADSTLRRNLGALVQAGLIRRHDSPNGKRYAARSGAGDITVAFGFDLRPLLERADEIARAAQAVEDAEQALRRQRERVSLLKRDAVKLTAFGAEEAPSDAWAEIEAQLLDLHRRMRRKLELDELSDLEQVLRDLMVQIHELIAGNSVSETKEMSGNDVQNERHHSNSKPYTPDLEPCPEEGRGAEPEPLPNIPLAVVLKACPDILPYSEDRPRHWHQLVGLAALVRGMMGISESAWQEAMQVMGPETAAVTVAGILQRVETIRNPGGYLRALTRKAQDKGFSPGPMIMALLQAEGQS